MKTISRSSSRKSIRDLSAEDLNRILQPLTAGERIRWIYEEFGSRVITSSSFGLQAAVMLHLVKNYAPEMPIIWIDTGYLFPETYQYADELINQLGVNIKIYQPNQTAARQEALHGKLWEQGEEGHQKYALINKIEPMNRALKDFSADVWLSGLRRTQSGSRSSRHFAEQQSKTLKVYPILDWSELDVQTYFAQHQLPAHPLVSQGYQTMGDWHSTQPVNEGESAEGSRFGGSKYECGLHLSSGANDFQI